MEITREVLMQLSIEEILLLDDVVEKMLQKQEQHAGGKANG